MVSDLTPKEKPAKLTNSVYYSFRWVLKYNQVSSKSERWHVSRLAGPLVESVLIVRGSRREVNDTLSLARLLFVISLRLQWLVAFSFRVMVLN